MAVHQGCHDLLDAPIVNRPVSTPRWPGLFVLRAVAPPLKGDWPARWPGRRDHSRRSALLAEPPIPLLPQVCRRRGGVETVKG